MTDTKNPAGPGNAGNKAARWLGGRHPHWLHYAALAVVHAGLGVVAALELGLPAAAADFAIAAVYAHLAFGGGRPPATGT